MLPQWHGFLVRVCSLSLRFCRTQTSTTYYSHVLVYTIEWRRGKNLPKDRHGTQNSRGRSGAVRPGEAEGRCDTGEAGWRCDTGEAGWRCDIGGGEVAPWYQGRRSGDLIKARRLCELIVTAKLVKKNYACSILRSKNSVTYTPVTQIIVLCAEDFVVRNACMAIRGHFVSPDQTCLRYTSWRHACFIWLISLIN